MEDALVLVRWIYLGWRFNVLILVLMEDALVHKEARKTIKKQLGLNPCFNEDALVPDGSGETDRR